MRQANKGFRASPASRPATQAGSCCNAACSANAIATTTTAPAIQAAAPRANTRASGSPTDPANGAMRCPAACRYRPIHTTGCQRAAGSPNAWSSPKATHSATSRTDASIQSSMPRCAGTPALNACLTLCISVTVSASSTISGGQRRPVIATCTSRGRSRSVASTSSSGSQP